MCARRGWAAARACGLRARRRVSRSLVFVDARLVDRVTVSCSASSVACHTPSSRLVQSKQDYPPARTPRRHQKKDTQNGIRFFSEGASSAYHTPASTFFCNPNPLTHSSASPLDSTRLALPLLLLLLLSYPLYKTPSRLGMFAISPAIPSSRIYIYTSISLAFFRLSSFWCVSGGRDDRTDIYVRMLFSVLVYLSHLCYHLSVSGTAFLSSLGDRLSSRAAPFSFYF